MRRRACAWLLFPTRRSQRQTWPSQDKLKTSLIHYLFKNQNKVQNNFQPSTFNLHLFYNARSALYHGIQALGIGTKDEIILQAYTCVSVSNAIIATGATPIYCDIDPETLNIDPKKIQKLITPQTKAILIQHTFGIPADIEAIKKICSDNNLALIEDCCHALGGDINGQKLGTFWDIAIFSFGRDKVISSVNGGALLTNTTSPSFPLLSKRDDHKRLATIRGANIGGEVLPRREMSRSDSVVAEGNREKEGHEARWGSIGKKVIIQNLLYIILWQLCKISYSIGIGKFLYYLAGKYHLFPTIVTKAEKECHYTDFNFSMPNCLADIALYELNRIDEYNKIRRRNSQLYTSLLFPSQQDKKDGILRYLYLTPHPKKLSALMKKNGVMIGDWYQQVIAPKETNNKKACYKTWSCPIAESIASQSVNLPNHAEITEYDVRKVVEIINTSL